MRISIGVVSFALFAAAHMGEARAQIDGAVERHDPLPLVFERNLGQFDPSVDFMARGKGFAVVLCEGEALLRPASEGLDAPPPLRLQLIGANDGPVPMAGPTLPGRVNYLKGSDPAAWKIGVPLYESAGYTDVYPGIDVVYYPNLGELEYDFIVHPGASHADIRLRFEGADSVQVDAEGRLLLGLATGEMVQHAPVTYQTISGQRVPLESRYAVHGDGSLGFVIGEHDPAHDLVIDPVVTYSSYVSGSGFESAASVVVPPFAGGRPPFYVCGSTDSAGLGLTPDTTLSGGGDRDIFVARINPYAQGAGTLEWLTIIGGSGVDTASDMAYYQATDGYLFIAGSTTSADWPATDGFDNTLGGAQDGLLFALKNDGVDLQASSFIGGSGVDSAVALTNNNTTIYLTGATASNDFPVAGGNAFQTAANPNLVQDTYLVRTEFVSLDELSVPSYATYLGSENCFPTDIAFNSFEMVTVVGGTRDGLVTKNEFQATLGGIQDGFICQFDLLPSIAADTLVYSSYLGGNGADVINSVAFNSTTVLYVAGGTSSTNLDNFGNSLNGGRDGFLSKINPSTSSLSWTAIYGGNGNDEFLELAVEAADKVFLAGATDSTTGILIGSPIFDPISTQLNSGDSTVEQDIWLLRIPDIPGSPISTPAPEFSSYYGGAGSEGPTGLARDNQGRYYLSGQTTSGDFPLTNAFQEKAIGAQEGFVSMLQDVIFVDRAQSNVFPCGDSWQDACRDLIEGTNSAGTNKEIWVKAATYNDPDISLQNGSALYGGFSGGETLRDQRNPVVNVTKHTPLAGNAAISVLGNNRVDGFQYVGALGGNHGPFVISGVLNVDVSNCFFYQNAPVEDGGGMYIEGGSSDIRISNCVFTDNNAQRGGGIAVIDSSAVIANCTFAINNATVEPETGAIYYSSSSGSLSIVNSIVWGLGDGSILIDFDGLAPTISNSILQGGLPPGTNILASDPQFIQSPVAGLLAGDLRLGDGSPARNAGVDTSGALFGYIYKDFEGSARIIAGASCGYDIGAYESEIDPPTITLNGAAPLEIEVGTAYTELGATAIDGCGESLTGIIGIDATAVNTAVVGDYDVTYNVTDARGVSAAQVIRQVQVVDTTPPVITLNGTSSITVECGSVYTDAGATALDNVDGNLSTSILIANPVNTNAPNVYTISYNVTDSSGNAAIAVTRTVTVQDSTPPVITLSGDSTVTVECGSSYLDAGATALDACDGDLSTSIVVTGLSGVNTAVVGDYNITYDVQDAVGLGAAQVVRTVQVRDTKAPVIVLAGADPVVLECGQGYTEPGFSANDDCMGVLTGDVTVTDNIDPNTPGTYQVDYEVQDVNGNTATEQRTVIVEDTGAPTIVLNGSPSVTVPCGGVYIDAGATASDACGGDLTGDIVTGGLAGVDTTTVGTYLVTYDVQDAEGNAALRLTRTVNVVDNTAPVITLNGENPLQLECGSLFTDPGAIASDACDGTITPAFSGEVDVNNPGVYTITYTAQDLAGNNAIAVQRSVEVIDSIQPEITLNAPALVVLECGDTYAEPGFTASDSCDGDLTGFVVVGGDTVDTGTPGTYEIEYFVTDTEGNASAVVTRQVLVEDDTVPVITLLGANPITLDCGSNYVEPGATVADTCDASTPLVISGDVVDSSTPGTYLVRYDAQDAGGNNATQQTRTVIVVDAVPPALTLLGATSVTLECGEAYVESGYTAGDACDGDLTGSVNVRIASLAKLGENLSVGDYLIEYEVFDATGNRTVESRSLSVVDTTPPVISLDGAVVVNLSCGAPYVEPGATALDACDGGVPVSIGGDTVDTGTVGVYTITYDAFDNEGNAAVQVTRTVNVLADGVPVINLIGDGTVTVECGGVYTELGATAQDDCAIDLTGDIVIGGDTVNPSAPGTYVVTYTVEDADGNEAQVSRTVEVEDNTAPVVTLIGAATQTVQCGAAYVDPGATAVDVCDGDLTGSISESLLKGVDTNVPGVYTLEYSVEDAAGNRGTAIRTVTVADTAPPAITLLGSPSVTIDCGDAYADAGATASDSCAGVLTGNIVRTGLVDTDTPGVYTLQFNVSDTSGNAAAAVTRTVTVRNNCVAEGEGEGAAEGALEGNEEGALEGAVEGEGEIEGAEEGEEEGSIEGEGETPVDCDAPCDDAPRVDNDGDGLTTCEEIFFGTSDNNTDSDGDGMPDNFEARHCPELDPTDPSDAFLNPDGDSFDNLEEFLRGGDPLDPASPSNNVFVAPFNAGGVDDPGRGRSPSAPWATIRFALSQIDPSPEEPINIILADGTYTENLVLKSGVSLFPQRGARPVIVGAIIGAEACSLVDLIISPRTGPVALLSVDNAAMRVIRCIFRGPTRKDSTGIVITGQRVREVEIESCLFERLAVGIDVDAGHPALRRSFFENLSAAGIIIRCPESGQPFSQYDGDDARVGFNTFEEGLGVPAVINECPVPANMERNDWGLEDPTAPGAIDGVIAGTVNFDNFLKLGGALFAGSLFCTVWDAEDQEPILNARVALQPVVAAAVTENRQGVYAFPALASGAYTLNITAPGYEARTQQVQLADGELASVIVAMRFNGVIEEGEGEGEDPPTGGCPCNQGDKLGPPQPGDLMLTLLTFATLALSTLLLRRQAQRALE